MLIRASALLLAVLVLCSGCVLRPGIHGSGVSHSEFRPIPNGFEEVDLSGFGTVNILVGEPYSVCVTTDDNLVEHIETSVDNGKLKIKTRGRLKPKTGLTVDVTVPQLSAAHISGAGDMNVIDVSSESLDLSISGAGTLMATGCVDEISTSISGAGDAELENLIARHAHVKVAGAGDVSIFATESVTARVAGAGDVVCYGNPLHVDQRIAGAGDFIMKDSQEQQQYSLGDEF